MGDHSDFFEDSVLTEQPAQSEPAQKRPRNQRFYLGVVFLVLLCLSLLYAGARGGLAAWAGFRGRSAIARAETAIRGQQLDAARIELAAAENSFRRMRSELGNLGPAGAIARVTPLLRQQIRSIDAMADAGVIASGAGEQVADAVAQLADPSVQQASIAVAREPLARLGDTLQEGRLALDDAFGRVSEFDKYRLVWPISAVRSELRRRLDDARTQAASAEEGLNAFVIFMGGEGPRRYLLFSQNPDELRPTGGFIGSYGVFGADAEGFRMERYDDIAQWFAAHPGALIPTERAGPPFKFGGLPQPNIRNVNTAPDWPTAAQLASEIWAQAGEQPVDGIIGVTPAFLVRLLAVTGPVRVESYGETIAASNAVERIDYYTHRDPNRGADRKDIIGAISEAVLREVVRTPGSKWLALGSALGGAFDARDAIAWVQDAEVSRVLRERRWDGVLPETGGDFFYNGEFAYISKNGRGIKRTFDHRVDLRADGTAHAETVITVTNTEPFEAIVNEDSAAYITIYGPRGATLDPTSHRPAAIEPNVAGHPAAGWFLSAAPGRSVQLKVVWEAPNILRKLADGTWVYALWWMKLPDHTGDAVNLSVNLPEGWRWKGEEPPGNIPLDSDIIKTWEVLPSS